MQNGKEQREHIFLLIYLICRIIIVIYVLTLINDAG